MLNIYLQNVDLCSEKKFEWSKSLFLRFPPPDKKIPPNGNSPTPSYYLKNPLFRTQSKIYDEAFCKNRKQLKVTNYLHKTAIYIKDD